MNAGVVHCSTHAHTDTTTHTVSLSRLWICHFASAVSTQCTFAKAMTKRCVGFFMCTVHNSCVCTLLQNARAYLTWPTPIRLALFSLAISTGCESMLDPRLWVTSPPPLIPLHSPLSSPVWLFDSQHHEISNCGIFLSQACIVISQKDVNRFA